MFKPIPKFLLSIIIFVFMSTNVIAQTSVPPTNVNVSENTSAPITFSVLVNYTDPKNPANTGIKQLTIRQARSSTSIIDSKPLPNATTRYNLTGTFTTASCSCPCPCNFISLVVQIIGNDNSLFQFKGICALQNFLNGNPITEYQFDIDANLLTNIKPGTFGVPLVIHQIDASTDQNSKNSINANNCLLERF